MDYESELAKLSDAQLEAIVKEPENAFAPQLWAALQAERLRRRVPKPLAEAIRRSSISPSPIQDVNSWMGVAILMRSGATPDKVFQMIAGAIARDPMLAPFRQVGYPLDLQVSFPATLGSGSDSMPALEHMWVRTVGVTRNHNCWVGRILNTPNLFKLAEKGDYIEFRSDESGLHFERLTNAAIV